jgi:voltage-gated potassium channel Kch
LELARLPLLSVITLTTVGYGDFSPCTTAGKIFTMVYVFVGISLILRFLNAIAERSVEQHGGICRLLGRRAKGGGSEREEDPKEPDE